MVNPTPANVPSVLILGARGRLGLAATRAFAQAGWRVLAQVRPGASTSSSAFAGLAGVQTLALSLDDPAALARAAMGATVVVHAINPQYTDAQWTAVAPALLEAGIQVARQLKATFMLPGNVYNFGETMPAELTESTLQSATTVKGAARIAMEQRLAKAVTQEGLRVVVIRAGDFFGSGTGTMFDQAIVAKLPKGRMTYFGALDIATAWAYLPDLARTFVAVATLQARHPDRLSPFEVLHFSGHTLSGQDWADVLTDLAWEQGWLREGGRLAIGTLPWPLIRLGALFNPVWAALLEMRYLWQRPHHLDNRKLVALMGGEPHTPLPVAVRATLADLGLLRQPMTPSVTPSVVPSVAPSLPEQRRQPA